MLRHLRSVSAAVKNNQSADSNMFDLTDIFLKKQRLRLTYCVLEISDMYSRVAYENITVNMF